MFKQRVNEAAIDIVISAAGPILIKASESGSDPTRPDMEFVQTYHQGASTIYLPGSSLKGAFRSHAERIVRTVGGDSPNARPWSCDPLKNDSPCRKAQGKFPDTFKNSCFICRIFGSTEAASHCTIGDAYPLDASKIVLEERNGVALDRKLGSVAVGPFNFQVATEGEFSTTIRLVNFSLDQLALVGLVIRDFDTQMVSLGFAKSRGLGQVQVKISQLRIKYPGCIVEDGKILCLQNKKTFALTETLGVGALMEGAGNYGYPHDDKITAKCSGSEDPMGMGVVQSVPADALNDLWRGAVGAWKKQVGARAK